MSNLGFRLAMQRGGSRVVETAGRRPLRARGARQGGFTLGGEQSGHVIFRDRATTGDGLLTGVLLADVVNRSGAARRARRRGDDAAAPGARQHPGRRAGRRRRRAGRRRDRRRRGQLAGNGRVLLRPSGTEPLLRVMVEATDDMSPTRRPSTSPAVVAALGQVAHGYRRPHEAATGADRLPPPSPRATIVAGDAAVRARQRPNGEGRRRPLGAVVEGSAPSGVPGAADRARSRRARQRRPPSAVAFLGLLRALGGRPVRRERRRVTAPGSDTFVLHGPVAIAKQHDGSSTVRQRAVDCNDADECARSATSASPVSPSTSRSTVSRWPSG